LAAGRDGGLVERIDLGSGVGDEGDVNTWAGLARVRQPKERLAVAAEPGSIRASRRRLRNLLQHTNAERLQGRSIERFGLGEIGHAERGVIYAGHWIGFLRNNRLVSFPLAGRG